MGKKLILAGYLISVLAAGFCIVKAVSVPSVLYFIMALIFALLVSFFEAVSPKK